MNALRSEGRRLRPAIVTAGLAAGSLAIGTALWDGPGPAARTQDAEADQGCFIVQHSYYPKAGKREEVLATRKQGSEVRVALGLPTGRLLVLQDSARGHPAKGEQRPGDAAYLMSITEYESEAAADRARQSLMQSDAYRAVIGRMAELIADFEQASWRVAYGSCKPDRAS